VFEDEAGFGVDYGGVCGEVVEDELAEGVGGRGGYVE
jgi:hypothetical protein